MRLLDVEEQANQAEERLAKEATKLAETSQRITKRLEQLNANALEIQVSGNSDEQLQNILRRTEEPFPELDLSEPEERALKARRDAGAVRLKACEDIERIIREHAQ